MYFPAIKPTWPLRAGVLYKSQVSFKAENAACSSLSHGTSLQLSGITAGDHAHPLNPHQSTTSCFSPLIKKKIKLNYATLQQLQAKRVHTGERSSADGWELVMLKELPIEPEPQAMLQLEAGSGGNNLLSSFSVCPPCTSPTRSLSVLQATLSDEENQLTTPQLSTITQYQLSTWDLAALKATFLGITDSFSGFFSHGSIPYPEALHQTCHPMKQGFSGAPHSSVPGCWLFSWHAAWLGDGSPALLTPLSLLSPTTRCFWRGKQSKNWAPLVS